MNRIRHGVLLAQVDPPIHGQAIMSALLAKESEGWQDFRFTVINAAYATDRASLGGFSFGKVLRWISFLARVTKELSFGKADTVVMTHSFFRGPFLKDSAFVWLVKRLFGRRLFVWVHMDPSRLGWETLPDVFHRHAVRTLALPDRWVACSPALTAGWPDEFPRDRVTSICNGIPDPAEGRLASPGDGRHIVFLSAMTEEKGWKELFRTASRLCGEDPLLRVSFYGSPGAGEDEESLRAAFAAGTHPDRITWKGAVWDDAKAEALRAADLFCFPSWTEAFPLAVLDAMAFGLPVVASDVGGVHDALSAGEGAWLIPPRDEAALESALREALASPSRLREMGARNRARFLERFNASAFGRAWHDLLTDPALCS